MKKKMIDFIIDVLLIGAVFALTDVVTINFFHSESVWLELLVYLVFYAVAFGAKRGVEILWHRFRSRKKDGDASAPQEELL